MDILIKGLELPKTENDNFMVIVTPTEVIDVVENGNGFMMQKKYEAIELKSHGRLIDADALSQNTIMIERNIERNGLLYKQYDTVVFVDDIENAPTVVEATE